MKESIEILNYFNKVYKLSIARKLNNLQLYELISKNIYNFTEFHRCEFLNYVINYGIYFDSLEKFW